MDQNGALQAKMASQKTILVSLGLRSGLEKVIWPNAYLLTQELLTKNQENQNKQKFSNFTCIAWKKKAFFPEDIEGTELLQNFRELSLWELFS